MSLVSSHVSGGIQVEIPTEIYFQTPLPALCIETTASFPINSEMPGVSIAFQDIILGSFFYFVTADG